jgi:hypothetical protein
VIEFMPAPVSRFIAPLLSVAVRSDGAGLLQPFPCTLRTGA